MKRIQRHRTKGWKMPADAIYAWLGDLLAIEREAVADYLASAEFVERLAAICAEVLPSDPQQQAAAIARALTGDSNERT